MKRYTLENYKETFFNTYTEMAEAWGIHPRDISDWRKAGYYFEVDGSEHTRCKEMNYILYGVES